MYHIHSYLEPAGIGLEHTWSYVAGWHDPTMGALEKPIDFVYRTVASGGPFGASPLQEHIGPDKNASIETLVVNWPSGTRDILQTNMAGMAHHTSARRYLLPVEVKCYNRLEQTPDGIASCYSDQSSLRCATNHLLCGPHGP